MNEQLISGFLAALPLPAVLVESGERIIGANEDAHSLLGQQIIGRHFATLLRQPQVIEAIEKCLQEREPLQTQHLGSDGRQDTTFRVYCRYIDAIGTGDRGAVLVSFRDVSDLEQAGQMRRDFIANVSHELRTPLTALMGFIETLQGPAKDDATARDRFLAIMASEATRMNRLVGDLLSLNRVESRERVRPDQTVDLSTQVRSTCNSLQPLADTRGTVLEVKLPAQAVRISGDEDQLRQVLTNLIENAIKYGNENGHVTIELSIQERDLALRGPSARIQVSDDGPGIDAIHLPRLTERFYRADTHRSREMGGTGLGLAIVKHIINRHRGRFRAESPAGQGACFTVILPLDPGSKSA